MTTVASVVLMLLIPVLLVNAVEGTHGIDAGTPAGDFAHISSGQSRKLLTEAPGIHKLKTTQIHGKETLQRFSTSPPAAATEGGSRADEANHELADLAGMDYSPADKKPPIHN